MALEKAPPEDRLIQALGVAGVFMAMRAGINVLVPADTSGEFLLRDTAMNLPRIVCLFLAIWVGTRHWTSEEVGFHLRGWRRSLIFGVLLVGLDWTYRALTYSRSDFGISELVLLGANALLIGLVEEALFRGIIYRALENWKNSSVALWGSTLCFTVWHFQAQPLWKWPMIFLIGLLFGVLRSQRVSMFWLAGVHFALELVGTLYALNLVNWGPYLAYLASLGFLALAAAIAGPRALAHATSGRAPATLLPAPFDRTDHAA